MESSFVHRLNRVNREFYRRHAESFATTRQAPWPGWARLLEPFSPSGPESVRDRGCGNGRFGRYRESQGMFPRSYVGADRSLDLLLRARRALDTSEARSRCRWLATDLIEPWTRDQGLPLTGEGFSLVVLLGVLHHVPGRSTRAALLEAAAGLVAPGGVLAVTVWLFTRSERMRRRLRAPEGIDPADLEPGDYLMPWGAGSSGEDAVRYCHALSQAEAAEISARLPLTPLADFEADGASGNLNRYLLWRRK